MIVEAKLTGALEAKEFCKGVRAVVKAAAKGSNNRCSIEDINFSYKSGSDPVLVATDGYILGIYSFKNWVPGEEFDVLLDVKQLMSMVRELELAKIMTQYHQAPPKINKRKEYYVPTHTCKFEFLGDVLKISSEFVQDTYGLDTSGSYEGEVDIDPSPWPFEWVEFFNAEKLVKAVSSFDTDRLRIYLNKSDKPSMIKESESKLVYLFLAFKPDE